MLPAKFDRLDECDASGWSGEQTLDIEAVHATAPGANILYVGAQNCFNTLFDSLRTIVDNGLADVITNSWGDTGGDLFDDAATRASVDNTLLMAAGTGISVLVSSGDDGDEFSTVGISVPDYPGVEPVDHRGRRHEPADRCRRTSTWARSAGRPARSFLCNGPMLGSPGCTKATLNTWLPSNYDAGGSGGGTSYSYTQPYYQAGIVPNRPRDAERAALRSTPDPRRARHLDGRRSRAPGSSSVRPRSSPTAPTTTSTASVARASRHRCSPVSSRSPISSRVSRSGSSTR